MHADDSHNNKPGFFSKIFGHDDATSQTPAGVDPGTVVEPNVPQEAEVATPEVSAPADQVIPEVADVQLQSGTMSDVRATSTGAEALDLSNVASTPADVPSDKNDAEDNMFQLPDIKTTEAPSNPTVDVIMPTTDTPMPTEETPAPTPSDDSHDEVVFDSTQPQPEVTPEADVSSPSMPMVPAPQPSITPESVAPEAPAEPTISAAPGEEAAEDVEPPAPPVEEGQAWSAEKESSQATPDSSPSAPVTPVTPESPLPQKELETAQGSMNTILAAHSDLTTDPPQAEETGLAPKTESSVTPTLGSPDDKPNDMPNPERQAAVARLQGHIDDLEANLQKVRDELDALR